MTRETRYDTTTDSKLHEFFVEQLQDLYWAEKKLVKTLPKLEDAATSEQLKNASDQLEKKNQQLKSLTDQNTGMIIGEYTLYLVEQPSFR